jgi:hypothetical protein
MQTTLRRMCTVTVALGLLVGAGAANAQLTTVSGTTTNAVQVGRTEIFLGNDPVDTARLESVTRTLVSIHPDWNGASWFSVRFSDPHARRERRGFGHAVVTYPGGDQAFLIYEYQLKSLVGAEIEFETKGLFLRGTGKFQGITGTWRDRGWYTLTESSSEWTVEYKIK